MRLVATGRDGMAMECTKHTHVRCLLYFWQWADEEPGVPPCYRRGKRGPEHLCLTLVNSLVSGQTVESIQSLLTLICTAASLLWHVWLKTHRRLWCNMYYKDMWKNLYVAGHLSKSKQPLGVEKVSVLWKDDAPLPDPCRDVGSQTPVSGPRPYLYSLPKWSHSVPWL